jgi:O-antigen/teichoic acid export membrane protein
MTSESVAERPGHLRGLARATTLNLVGSGVAALATLALLMILTKGLGQGIAGAFLSAVALFQILSISASLGVETGLVKWISGRQNESSRLAYSELLGVSLTPVLIVSLLATIAAHSFASSIGSFVGGDTLAGEATALISTMTLFITPAALTYALLGATRGYGTMMPTVMVDRLGRSLAQIAGVGIAVLAGASPTVIAVVWGLPYLAEYVVAAHWLHLLQLGDADLPAQRRGWRQATAEFWGFTLPRAVASIFRATFQWFDVILVAGLASPEDAAVYAVATRLLQLGLLAAFSVGQAVEPRFGKALAADDIKFTRYIYQISTAWLILITWPMYILLALFAVTVLGVFGSGFVAGATAVVILSAAVMLGAGVGPVDVLLVMKGKSSWSLWNTAAALGLNLALNFLLIPLLGILGAAISLAASRVVANLLPLRQLNRLAELHPFGDVWMRAALTSTFIFGGAGIAAKIALGSSMTTAVVAFVGASLIYLPVLWLSGPAIGLDRTSILSTRSTV